MIRSRFIDNDSRLTSKWWLSGGIAGANCVGAYQPKGAPNTFSANMNLANPGEAITDYYHNWSREKGYSSYVDRTTLLVPTSSWSAIVRIDNRGLESWTWPLLSYTTAGDIRFGFCTNSVNTYFYNCTPGVGNYLVGGSLTGCLGIAGNKAYANGSEIGTISGTPGTATGVIRIFGGNTFNTIAAAIYNTTISVTQIAALTVAMNAL